MQDNENNTQTDLELPNNEAGAQAAEGETQGAEEYAFELPDGSKHKTQAEAFAHAQRLIQEKDLALVQAEAFQQGVHAFADRFPGTQTQHAPQANPEEERAQWENDYYTDPKKVIESVKSSAIEEAKKQIRSELTLQQQNEQVWSNFTMLHPDLADFREDVDATANIHAREIQAFVAAGKPKEAMDFVARKTRAKFEMYVEATKKRTELPRKQTDAPAPGGQTVTTGKKETTPVDFATQIRNHQRERLGY